MFFGTNTVFVVNFRFNQIVIDDVTITMCILQRCIMFYYNNINFIFKRPINVVLESVEIELPVWTGSKGQIM